jgi:hypothetical protein
MRKIYTLLFIVLCLISTRSIAQCASPITAPHLENFEGISLTNELPTCWAASNMSITCLTFTTGTPGSGSKYAGFYYTPPATNRFFTRAIHFDAGVTYSASIFYRTSGSGGASWSSVGIDIGANQSAVGLLPITSQSGVISSMIYTHLTHTFVVNVSGTYYISVNATGTGAGSEHYLIWDDLTITIPCSVGNNAPHLTFSPPSATICNGQNATFTMSGADLYNGSSNPVVTLTPNVTTGFQVVGTNTLTGCLTTSNALVVVKQTPNVMAIATNPTICPGKSTNLTGMGGATSHSWSTGQTTGQITVTPTVNSVYTVTGTTNGCSATATVGVNLYPAASITVANAVTDTACVGEQVTLNAMGANTYQWLDPFGIVRNGSSISIIPNASMNFTVTGTDGNGCTNEVNYLLQVSGCTGLKQNSNSSVLALYPNPFFDKFTVEFNNGNEKKISVTDISGRLVYAKESDLDKTVVEFQHFAKGIYYVKVQSGNQSKVFEIVKQ